MGVVTAEKQMRSSDEEMGEKMKSEDNERVFITINGLHSLPNQLSQLPVDAHQPL